MRLHELPLGMYWYARTSFGPEEFLVSIRSDSADGVGQVDEAAGAESLLITELRKPRGKLKLCLLNPAA